MVNKFKKGDIARVIDVGEDDDKVFNGCLVEVLEDFSEIPYVRVLEGVYKGEKTVLAMRQLEEPIINNKLNRKLYPNYVENNGYLIPEFSDKLNEAEDV